MELRTTRRLGRIVLLTQAVCLLMTTVDSTNGDCKNVAHFNRTGCKCYCVHENCDEPSSIICTKANFTNVTISDAFKHLPKSVEELRVRGDRLGELPRNIFGKKNDSMKLGLLDLSDNFITLIHGKTFHGVSSIRTLILDNNNWQIKQKLHVFSNFYNLEVLSLNNAFDDNIDGRRHYTDFYFVLYSVQLDNLKELHASHNNLSNGNLTIFEYLPSIKKINLAYNSFRYLHVEDGWLPNIENINLTHNLITGLSDNARKTFDKISHQRNISLDLSYNPFACDHKGQTLCEWMSCTAVHIEEKDKWRCALPPSLEGKALVSINETEVVCRAVPPASAKRKSNTSVIAVGIVFGIIGVLFLVVMFLNRHGLKRKAGNIIHSIGLALGVRSHSGYSDVQALSI